MKLIELGKALLTLGLAITKIVFCAIVISGILLFVWAIASS